MLGSSSDHAAVFFELAPPPTKINRRAADTTKLAQGLVSRHLENLQLSETKQFVIIVNLIVFIVSNLWYGIAPPATRSHGSTNACVSSFRLKRLEEGTDSCLVSSGSTLNIESSSHESWTV